jgi:hypothetical protein
MKKYIAFFLPQRFPRPPKISAREIKLKSLSMVHNTVSYMILTLPFLYLIPNFTHLPFMCFRHKSNGSFNLCHVFLPLGPGPHCFFCFIVIQSDLSHGLSKSSQYIHESTLGGGVGVTHIPVQFTLCYSHATGTRREAFVARKI